MTTNQTPQTNEVIQQAMRDIEDTLNILTNMTSAVDEIRHDTSKAVSETIHIETLLTLLKNVEHYFIFEHMYAPSLIGTSTAVEQLGIAINSISHLSNTISMMNHLGDFEREVTLNYVRIGVEAFRASQMIIYLMGLISVEINRLNETN